MVATLSNPYQDSAGNWWYQDPAGNWYLYWNGNWYLYWGGNYYSNYEGPWYADDNGNWYLYYSGQLHLYVADPPPASYAVLTALPPSGWGYYPYSSQFRQYGTEPTINILLAIAYNWYGRYPNGPKIGIGNISFQGGGPMPPHQSHQQGLNVDIRPLRSDWQESALTWADAIYSQSLTRELIQFIRATGQVSNILFNDPLLIQENLVQQYAGHDNHLHVSFNFT
jgi:hypothetical protein